MSLTYGNLDISMQKKGTDTNIIAKQFTEEKNYQIKYRYQLKINELFYRNTILVQYSNIHKMSIIMSKMYCVGYTNILYIITLSFRKIEMLRKMKAGQVNKKYNLS